MNALEHFDQNRSQQLPLRINPALQILWLTGFENVTRRKSFPSKLDCSDSGFVLCAVLLSFSLWPFSFASHPKPARCVGELSWPTLVSTGFVALPTPGIT